MPNPFDIDHMRHALRLSRCGLGRTWPNPAVGALVVKDGAVVGTGVTGKGGKPHAETEALTEAGANAKGATLYVTLEPCAHHGKTPPCTDAIIKAGIARVVAAVGDPNPKVSGKGFSQLTAAGIAVEEGTCAEEARKHHEGFFSVVMRGRPFVTLKLATSLDGKIALANGESKWITSEQSRMKAHQLRGFADAVLTGIGTVAKDDSALTCRIPGLEWRSPLRIVMDGNLRTPLEAKILPAWIITSEKTINSPQAKALEAKGATLLAVPEEEGKLSLVHTLKILAEKGITRLMVEAGGRLAASFMQAELVDRIYWFRAPLVIGDKGMAALQGQKSESLKDLPRFSLSSCKHIGPDQLEIYDLSLL